MWDFLRDNAWVAWAGAGAMLAAAELMSLDLVLLMLALGAFTGAGASALGAPFVLSLILAIVTSVALLGLLRPSLVARFHSGAELVTGHAALVGQTGTTLGAVDEQGGQVRLSGEIWTARAFDPLTPIEPGTKVRVFEIDGATAVVHPD